MDSSKAAQTAIEEARIKSEPFTREYINRVKAGGPATPEKGLPVDSDGVVIKPKLPTNPKESSPPSGASSAIEGFAGKAFILLNFFQIGKHLYDVYTGNDYGTIPFLQVPGGPEFIIDKKQNFEHHMRDRGIDVNKLEGKEIEENGVIYTIRNGLPVLES